MLVTRINLLLVLVFSQYLFVIKLSSDLSFKFTCDHIQYMLKNLVITNNKNNNSLDHHSAFNKNEKMWLCSESFNPMVNCTYNDIRAAN